MSKRVCQSKVHKIDTQTRSSLRQPSFVATPGFEDSTSHFSTFHGVNQRRESTYIAVSRSVDTRKDEFRSNNKPNFCDRIFATGFDPYIVISLFPTQQSHRTNPIYDVKRACKFRKEDNNKFSFDIPKEIDWKQICLRLVLFDAELIWDKQVGGAFLWVTDVVDDIGDEQTEDVTMRRHDNYCGSLTVKLDFQRKEDGGEDLCLNIVILQGTHLKKDYDPEISVFYSAKVAIASIIGFILYLMVVAAIFYEVEKNDNSALTGFWDAFWFTFITATTVGFGDIVPKTEIGLYLNCVFIFLDFAFIGYLVTLAFDFVAASFEKAGREMNQHGLENEFNEKRAQKFIRRKLGIEDGTALNTKYFQNFEAVHWYDDIKSFFGDYFAVIVMIIVFLCLLCVGTILWLFLEGFNFNEAFQFNIVSISTVGYGDIAPANGYGRVCCVIYNLLGISLFISLSQNLVEILIIEKRQIKLNRKIQEELIMHQEQIFELDADGDGRITKYEFLKASLISLGKAYPADFINIENRFSALDVDSNGAICKQDFIKKDDEKSSDEEYVEEAGSLALEFLDSQNNLNTHDSLRLYKQISLEDHNNISDEKEEENALAGQLDDHEKKQNHKRSDDIISSPQLSLQKKKLVDIIDRHISDIGDDDIHESTPVFPPSNEKKDNIEVGTSDISSENEEIPEIFIQTKPKLSIDPQTISLLQFTNQNQTPMVYVTINNASTAQNQTKQTLDI